MRKELKLPKPPLTRFIKEGTIGTCPKCHSTEKKRWFKVVGCINPNCDNYYKNK
jgi:hypothetical protein